MADETIPPKVTPRKDLTAEFVRAVLDYDPSTGLLRWRKRDNAGGGFNKVFSGRVAGVTDRKGSLIVTIKGVHYSAHRLIWLIVTGEWPKHDIDHKDRNPANNRFDNLRPATRMQNTCNQKLRADNTSGFKGVTYRASTGMYLAQIRAKGIYMYLGSYRTGEEAFAAYCEAAKVHHGEFANPIRAHT